MMARIANGAALLVFMTLSGCSSGQLNRDSVFTQSSSTSLVMLGVELETEFKSPDFVFGRYDPDTGRVDLSHFYHATPRFDQLTGEQKLGEYLESQRPVGHVYLVMDLPPGEWFLWRVSASHKEPFGNRTFATTTVLSDGTILISSKPGVALYLGEFVLKAKYNQNLTLDLAGRDFAAARAELDKFRGVNVRLLDEEPVITTFTCIKREGKRECDPTQVALPR